MSVKAMTWVFEHSPLTGAARCVHLALADVANDDYENRLWLTLDRVAAKAKASRGTVKSTVTELERLGLLRVVSQSRGRHPSELQLLFPEPISGSRVEPANGSRVEDHQPISDSRVEPANLDAQPANLGNSRLFINSRELKRENSTVRDDDSFETFWKAYPRRNGTRVGKVAARRQWDRLKPDERVAAFDGLTAYATAKGAYPEDAERYLRHRRWVGLEVETSDERGARIVAGAEAFAESLGWK